MVWFWPTMPKRGAAVIAMRRSRSSFCPVISERTLSSGQTSSVDIEIKHAGPNIVEIEASPLENELTLVNNRAVVAIDGVRDKLRVLLVSGEPHSGERTWRNLLKSDASVDLVHFTILRPPEKQDGTPTGTVRWSMTSPSRRTVTCAVVELPAP